jgi:hypothetical protein
MHGLFLEYARNEGSHEKTSVDKNYNTALWKNKIGVPGSSLARNRQPPRRAPKSIETSRLSVVALPFERIAHIFSLR